MTLSPTLRSLAEEYRVQEAQLRLGGGADAIERQHSKGRKTARERIGALLDRRSPSLEIGLWAAYQMYEEWGGAVERGGRDDHRARSRAGG